MIKKEEDREKFEVVFVEGIEDDFIKYNISEEDILRIKIILTLHQQQVLSSSSFLKGIKHKIRKYRLFGKYRLFFCVKDYTIYCLAFLHRKECYKKESINKILTLVKEINK